MRGLNAKPVRIEADDDSGEWIEIKAFLSRSDKDYIQKAMFDMRYSRDSGVDMELITIDSDTALLEVGIVDWHLLDEQGEDFPYARDRAKDLPRAEVAPLIDKVLGEIAARNPISKEPKESDGSET